MIFWVKSPAIKGRDLSIDFTQNVMKHTPAFSLLIAMRSALTGVWCAEGGAIPVPPEAARRLYLRRRHYRRRLPSRRLQRLRLWPTRAKYQNLSIGIRASLSALQSVAKKAGVCFS